MDPMRTLAVLTKTLALAKQVVAPGVMLEPSNQLAIQSKMPVDFHQLSLHVIHFHLSLNQGTMENIMEERDTIREEVNNLMTRCTSSLVFQYVQKFTRRLHHISIKIRRMLWKNS